MGALFGGDSERQDRHPLRDGRSAGLGRGGGNQKCKQRGKDLLGGGGSTGTARKKIPGPFQGIPNGSGTGGDQLFLARGEIYNFKKAQNFGKKPPVHKKMESGFKGK